MIRKTLRSPTKGELVSFVLGVGSAMVVAALLWSRITSDPARMSSALAANPELLADHPEVLEAARSAMRARTLASQGVVRGELLRGKWAAFTHPAVSPGIGAADAATTLIEFTDYTCVPCKASEPVVQRVLASQPDLRVAIMLLPTGGAIAELAARVALAAYRHDPTRFAKLHHLLMTQEGPLTQDIILASAAAAGFDTARIQREIGNPQLRADLERVQSLAADLQITGVPAFAVGEHLILGGVSETQMRALLRGVPASSSAARSGRPATQPGEHH